MSHFGYACATQSTSRYVLLGKSNNPTSVSSIGSDFLGHSVRNFSVSKVYGGKQRNGHCPLKVFFFFFLMI